MNWRPPLSAGALTYLLALVSYYPMLLLHYLRHHEANWDEAILQASIGEHSLQALLFSLAFVPVGALGHRRILGDHAGRTVLFPTAIGVLLGCLVLSWGPPEVLAVGFLMTLLGFAGTLFLSRLEAAPSPSPESN